MKDMVYLIHSTRKVNFIIAVFVYEDEANDYVNNVEGTTIRPIPLEDIHENI